MSFDRDVIIAYPVLFIVFFIGIRYGFVWLWDIGIRSNILVVFGVAWFFVSMIIGGAVAELIGLDKRARNARRGWK